MTQPPPAVDPRRCPLCGQANQCAMEIERATGVKQASCWCASEKVPPELLERIATAERGQACLCAACIKAAQAT